MKNKNAKAVIIVLIIAVIVIIGVLVNKQEKKPIDITAQPNYNEQLESAILRKNAEIEADAKNTEWIVVTEEMEAEQNSETESDIRVTALKESGFKVKNSIIEPHVLGGAEVAIYHNESNLPWNLEKGDKVKFKIYIDSRYYGAYGGLCFGHLTGEESFTTENVLIKGERFDTDEEKEYVKDFEYVVPEDGDYRFYLFRSAMEAIIVNGLEVSVE